MKKVLVAALHTCNEAHHDLGGPTDGIREPDMRRTAGNSV